MTQTNFNINEDTATGLEVINHIELLGQALSSANSGDTAPTDIEVGMLWLDTTEDGGGNFTLKICVNQLGSDENKWKPIAKVNSLSNTVSLHPDYLTQDSISGNIGLSRANSFFTSSDHIPLGGHFIGSGWGRCSAANWNNASRRIDFLRYLRDNIPFISEIGPTTLSDEFNSGFRFKVVNYQYIPIFTPYSTTGIDTFVLNDTNTDSWQLFDSRGDVQTNPSRPDNISGNDNNRDRLSDVSGEDVRSGDFRQLDRQVGNIPTVDVKPFSHIELDSNNLADQSATRTSTSSETLSTLPISARHFTVDSRSDYGGGLQVLCNMICRRIS